LSEYVFLDEFDKIVPDEQSTCLKQIVMWESKSIKLIKGKIPPPLTQPSASNIETFEIVYKMTGNEQKIVKTEFKGSASLSELRQHLI